MLLVLVTSSFSCLFSLFCSCLFCSGSWSCSWLFLAFALSRALALCSGFRSSSCSRPCRLFSRFGSCFCPCSTHIPLLLLLSLSRSCARPCSSAFVSLRSCSCYFFLFLLPLFALGSRAPSCSRRCRLSLLSLRPRPCFSVFSSLPLPRPCSVLAVAANSQGGRDVLAAHRPAGRGRRGGPHGPLCDGPHRFADQLAPAGGGSHGLRGGFGGEEEEEEAEKDKVAKGGVGPLRGAKLLRRSLVLGRQTTPSSEQFSSPKTEETAVTFIGFL